METSGPGRLTWAELRLALGAPRPMAGFVSRAYPVGPLTLHVRQRGAGSPVHLLVHGLAVSHRYLMPTAARLPGTVLVPDLPGFGLSSKPRRVYGVAEHARVLAGWLDGLGVASAHLLANSYGCQVAVELAVRRPDLVATLVLVGPTADPAAATMVGQVRRWAHDLLYEDSRQAAILGRDTADAGLRRVVATLRDSVRDPITAKLPLVAAPILLLRGQHDQIVPWAWLERARDLAPRASAGQIERAAHNAITTAGARVAELASAFAERVDSH